MPLLSTVENLVSVLYEFQLENNAVRWLHLGAYAHMSGLATHLNLGFHFISGFSETGSMCYSRQVFDRLSQSDALSWKLLIQGYVNCGEFEVALSFYREMCENKSANASRHALVALLKACKQLRDIETGREIVCDMARKGFLEQDMYTSCSSVDLFAGCGALSQAQELFDKLPVRNLAVWNALVAGYAEHGHGSEALRCYRQMQQQGFCPDSVTLVCGLKACGWLKETDRGRGIHFDITRLGLNIETIVGNALVDFYAKDGSIDEAEAVFNMLEVQTVIAHTSLMAGYVEHGHGEKAIDCFESMQSKGTCLDVVTFVCSLKACCSLGAIDTGQKIHIEVSKYGLERHLVAGSTLVDMYGRCGSLAEACNVFDRLPVHDVVSWTTLMSAYVGNGQYEEALRSFDCVHKAGLLLGSVTFACILRACSSSRAVEKGREVHALTTTTGFLDGDSCVGSALVDMYAKCDVLAEAQDVFHNLLIKSVVSWTSLISGLVENGQGEEALKYFEQMRQEGVSPSVITFVCALKACSSMNDVDNGHTLHSEIVKRGGLERDTYIGSALIDMYVKCGFLESAHKVFTNLPVQNAVSWTALIIGYTEHDRGEDALYYFKLMRHAGVSPVPVTFIGAVKACGSLAVVDKGMGLHSEIIKRGQEAEVSLCHVLIDMYGKCGLLAEAKCVFNELSSQDCVSWMALISGFVDHGSAEEALHCLDEVQSIVVLCLDLKVLVCILKACSGTGAKLKGQEIHTETVKKGLDGDPLLGNTLVDTYSKCGSISEAQNVFDKLIVRDVISWTAMIAGYAELGESDKVISTFDIMLGESIKPDLVTYVSVLNACSHTGLVERGQFYFSAISKVHGLTPSEEHYICTVDLLCRAGLINTAIALIQEMPHESSNVVWKIVLGACRKWADVEIGMGAFDQVVELHINDAAAYVCMYNIYADAAMEKEDYCVEW